jgi:hypothetical protein
VNEREPTAGEPPEPADDSSPDAVDGGAQRAPADPDDPPADAGEPLNPA